MPIPSKTTFIGVPYYVFSINTTFVRYGKDRSTRTAGDISSPAPLFKRLTLERVVVVRPTAER